MRWRWAVLCVALLLPSLGAAAQVTLDWKDNSGNPCSTDPTKNCQERGFYVERKAEACAGSSAFTQIGEVGADVVTYVDPAVIAGTTYCYRVRAWNTECSPGSCKVLQPNGTYQCQLNCTGDLGNIQLSGYTNTAEARVAAVAAVPGMVWNAAVVAGSDVCDAAGCAWKVAWMEPTVDVNGNPLTDLAWTTLYTMLRGTTAVSKVEVVASARPGAVPVVATSAKMPIAVGQVGTVEVWITATSAAGESEARGLFPVVKDRTAEQLAPAVPTGLTIK